MDDLAQKDALQRMRKSLEGSTPKVLLIDDSKDDIQLVMHTLAQHGITDVVVLVSLANAMEVFTQGSPSDFRLVFLDLKLEQGRSGLELIDELKRVNPNAWVVVLSGAYAEDSDECKEALRRGAHAVMLKPLTSEKLKLIFATP